MLKKEEVMLINDQTVEKNTWKKEKERFTNTYSEKDFNFEEYDNELCKIIESMCLFIKINSKSEIFYSFIEFSSTITIEDGEKHKEDEKLKILLKTKVLEKIRSLLIEILQFGDFFYLNIKDMFLTNFFVDTGFNKEVYELIIKMEVLIGTRLLLGHKQLFIADLNMSLSKSLRTSINFESAELTLIDYKNMEIINNSAANRENVWKDKLWFNHLFHMFCPYTTKIPKLSHYRNILDKSLSFEDKYETLTCIIFFCFYGKK
jgi:hypothetical protein